MYLPYNGQIFEGFDMIENDISEAIDGDEIHFRFQSKLKKFSISFVSSIILDCFYLEFQKHEEFAFDIQEDINYFPFVQGNSNSSATLFKPEER